MYCDKHLLLISYLRSTSILPFLEKKICYYINYNNLAATNACHNTFRFYCQLNATQCFLPTTYCNDFYHIRCLIPVLPCLQTQILTISCDGSRTLSYFRKQLQFVITIIMKLIHKCTDDVAI